MRVEGANLGSYQPQHIPVVQRETPHSVKPNVFTEIEVEQQDANNAARALFGSDLVQLSPEARELLSIIRKRLKAGLPANLEDLEAAAPERLIYTLQELRRKLQDEEEQNDHRRRSRGLKHMPPSFTFQLSGPNLPQVEPDAPKPKRRSEAAALVSRMIVHTPGEEASHALTEELEVLGESVIEYVRSFGVKIILLQRHQTMGAVKIAGMYLVGRGEKTMDGRDWNVVRGLYDHGRKLIVMGEERIGRRSHSTPLHEFAHAYDHTFSDRNHRVMPLSVQLWNTFASTRKGLITAYAGTNPAEYFAESAEAWFAGGMRERLAQLDPQMYSWMEKLFAA